MTEKRQDGWIVTFRDTECFWEPTIAHALDRGIFEVESWDGAEGGVEVGSPAGSFTVSRAYRVDLGAAARIAASAATDALCDGTLETNWVEDHELASRMERDLARAFTAQIERVCGPWYEALGREAVEVEVVRTGDHDYCISSFDGSRSIVEEIWADGGVSYAEVSDER